MDNPNYPPMPNVSLVPYVQPPLPSVSPNAVSAQTLPNFSVVPARTNHHLVAVVSGPWPITPIYPNFSLAPYVQPPARAVSR